MITNLCVMKIKGLDSSRFNFAFCGVIAVSLLFTACIKKSDIDQFVNRVNEDGLNVSVKEPIQRDYSDIKETGTLRVITRYSSNTYFLHQGIEW